MISNLGFVFVVLPCIGAVIAGALLYDWRLAAAAACGALGLLLSAPLLPDVVRLLSSLMSGVAVGALALAVWLLWRPATVLWTRMSVAMLAAFVVHFIHLTYIAGRV